MMQKNHLEKIAYIPSIEGPIWNLVTTGQKVSEKKMFKDYTILFLYKPMDKVR